MKTIDMDANPMTDLQRVLAAAALYSLIDPVDEDGPTVPNLRDLIADVRTDLEARAVAAGDAVGQVSALGMATRYLRTAEERLGQVLADIMAAQGALARGSAGVND